MSFLRLQNADHCEYLLTALYFESLKVEPWETGATEADRAEYIFEGDVKAHHADAIAAIMNQGETLETVEEYKEKVMNAMGLEPLWIILCRAWYLIISPIK